MKSILFTNLASFLILCTEFNFKQELYNFRIKKLISRSTSTLGYNDRNFILIGIPVISIIISGILFGDHLLKEPLSFFSACVFVGVIYTSSFWLGFRELFIYSIKRFGKQHKKRYGFLLVSAVLLYVAIKLVLGVVVEQYIFDVHSYAGHENTQPHMISEILSSAVVIVMILAIYESSYLNTLLHESILEKQLLQKQNIQAQLEGIRNKVNPHFLFNSLNTLCHLIPESPERAEKFVRHLSKGLQIHT